MAAHLTIAGIATCWTWEGWGRHNHQEFPIAAMHPAFLTITTLERPERWFDGYSRGFWILPCYWTALVINIIWARWWLIRNFEWLVERTGARVVTKKKGISATRGREHTPMELSASPIVPGR